MPVVKTEHAISKDESVIYITGADFTPDGLNLSDTEKDYVKRCLADKPDYVTVNSFYKTTFIVPEKTGSDLNANFEELKKVSVKLVEEIRRGKILTVGVTSEGASEGSVGSMAEGLLLAAYTFEKYKGEANRKKDAHYPEKIFIKGQKKELATRLNILGRAVYFTRDRVNEPLSHLTAEGFAESVNEFCKEAGLKVETLTRKQIEALKMGGLIAVNKGSIDPPTMTIIEWKPDNAINKRPVALVGKGVVFDSGGLNLKPTGYIEEMKADMAGGAAVAAAIYYIAMMKLPLHVMAFIPATDNRPGKSAYAPGDVIRMFNGKSVEVLNTDAEGRLILADAMSYSGRYNPQLVITMATLTGSASSTFGNKAIAAMGNAGREIIDALGKAGFETWERIAELPFWDDYAELLKSDIADLKNVGGKEAGAITAGKFLEHFAEAPFVHLDIAGTAMQKKADYYRPGGGTGSGVRLLARFFEMMASGDVKLQKD